MHSVINCKSSWKTIHVDTLHGNLFILISQFFQKTPNGEKKLLSQRYLYSVSIISQATIRLYCLKNSWNSEFLEIQLIYISVHMFMYTYTPAHSAHWDIQGSIWNTSKLLDLWNIIATLFWLAWIFDLETTDEFVMLIKAFSF